MRRPIRTHTVFSLFTLHVCKTATKSDLTVSGLSKQSHSRQITRIEIEVRLLRFGLI